MKISLSAPAATLAYAPVFVLANSNDTQLVVGAALVALPPAELLILKNVSAGGQLIRVGIVPSFGPAHGILLNVNDVIVLDNVRAIPIQAIANGAGALLDVLTFMS